MDGEAAKLWEFANQTMTVSHWLHRPRDALLSTRLDYSMPHIDEPAKHDAKHDQHHGYQTSSVGDRGQANTAIGATAGTGTGGADTTADTSLYDQMQQREQTDKGTDKRVEIKKHMDQQHHAVATPEATTTAPGTDRISIKTSISPTSDTQATNKPASVSATSTSTANNSDGKRRANHKSKPPPTPQTQADTVSNAAATNNTADKHTVSSDAPPTMPGLAQGEHLLRTDSELQRALDAIGI